MNSSDFALTPPFYPARPINGGPLTKAPPKSGEWFYEPKYNDWRAILHVPTGQMWERHGKPLSIGNMFEKAVRQLQSIHVCRLEWLDCLALGRRHPLWRGTLVVLDLPDYASQPYRQRRQILRDLFDEPRSLLPDKDPPAIIIPPLVMGSLETWEQLQQINRMLGCQFYEGLVAKRADSLYPLQRRSPDIEFPFWVKHRWPF